VSGVFRALGEEELYRGSLVTLARAGFEAPDGRRFSREVVHHPGAVVVVAVEGGSTAWLVRQFRAPIGAELLELPAGKRDVDGEEPLETARRELEEEVGMRASRWRELARFYNSPGYCDELSYLFLAEELTPCRASPQGVEEAHMATQTVSLAEVPRLAAEGAIMDAKSILGLCLARSVLASGE
jgi:8-oxo-dGTP pyrophosphatase MutT (NUDIX family)